MHCDPLFIHYLSTIYPLFIDDFLLKPPYFVGGSPIAQGQVAQQHILWLQIAVDHRGLKTRQLQVGCEAYLMWMYLKMDENGV